MTNVLRLEKIGVAAGPIDILQDVSLEVLPGRIMALIGPNGAGKTTLLDAIAGEVPIDSGEVMIGDSGGLKFGRVLQNSPLPATLTVGEMAQLVTPDDRAATLLLERFGLKAYRRSFIAELSTGMRRILDLACAIAGEPDVLLLDEPASGLAQSEIEHLASLIIAWRDSRGGSVVLVEHDLSLVEAVSDEVLLLEQGKIVARGAPEKMLAAYGQVTSRSASNLDGPLSQSFAHIRSQRDRDELPLRSISTWTVLRLGLREFAAGLGSVMILGVLNRVMKVELGISLGIVALVLASYNLAAPIGIAVGHLSDRRPIGGRRRLPYIIAGAALTGLTVALAPRVAQLLAQGTSVVSVAASVGLFLAMGIGMYSAGSVYFALLSDLCSPEDRGHAVSIVYVELLAGVLCGVVLVQAIVDSQAEGLNTLFLVAGLLIISLSAIAVWGHEDRMPEQPQPDKHLPLRSAVASIVRLKQARLFFAFMLLSTFFLFLHQAVLEPYGGDVLGMSVRETSAFNAVMTVGTIVGMLTAGRPFLSRIGYKKIAARGMVLASLGFAMLSAAALISSTSITWLGILVLGLGSGAFTVAALALMMGMATAARTALFMGVWTMAHALADGAATAGGGVVFEIAGRLFANEPLSYATVFGVEAVGMLACILLLRSVRPKRFSEEVDQLAASELQSSSG